MQRHLCERASHRSWGLVVMLLEEDAFLFFVSRGHIRRLNRRPAARHTFRSSDRKVQRSVEPSLYRQRNLIERFFCKLKHFRRIATRFDTLARNFLAVQIDAFAVAMIALATLLRLVTGFGWQQGGYFALYPAILVSTPLLTEQNLTSNPGCDTRP